MLATRSGRDVARRPSPLREFSPPSAACTSALAPLDEASVAQLLDSPLKPPTPDWPQRLHRHTGSNLSSRLRSPPRRPHELRRAGWPRPHAHRASSAGAAPGLAQPRRPGPGGVAVAGADFDLCWPAPCCNARCWRLADAWAALEAAQVLQGQAFTHDLMAAATRQGLLRPSPPGARRRRGPAPEQTATAALAHLAAHWLAAKRPAQASAWLEPRGRPPRQWRLGREARFLSQMPSCSKPWTQPGCRRCCLSWRRARLRRRGFPTCHRARWSVRGLAAEGPERLQAC